ncbi:MAG: LPS export ABC transporter periplasmic protein LptC [Sphaerochaetaceae bacterium]
MKKGSLLWLLILLVVVLSGCSFAFKESDQFHLDLLPDLVLTNTTYKIKSSDEEPITIEAQTIEIYKNANKAFITKATFIQKDIDGTLIMSGSFNEGEIETTTNNLRLRKDVTIKNHKENFSLHGDNFDWHSDDKKVFSEKESLVTLINKEHDILKGRGFVGNFATSEFEFATMEEGILYYD